MRKLREKHGDDAIDQALARMKGNSDPQAD